MNILATSISSTQSGLKLSMHVNFKPEEPAASEVSFTDFLRVDIRVGTVVQVDDFPEAKKPSLILRIDFGPTIGVKKSSAQITAHYSREKLLGRQVAAVVNFPPRQIGPIQSEVLTLGFADAEGQVVLFQPDQRVPNGARLH